MIIKRHQIASAAALCVTHALVGVHAQNTSTAPAPMMAPAAPQAVIVTGTRASNRTQFDTLAPVDVFSREEIAAVESDDLNDVLAQLVPS